jgi:hypothetical protein
VLCLGVVHAEQLLYLAVQYIAAVHYTQSTSTQRHLIKPHINSHSLYPHSPLTSLLVWLSLISSLRHLKIFRTSRPTPLNRPPPRPTPSCDFTSSSTSCSHGRFGLSHARNFLRNDINLTARTLCSSACCNGDIHLVPRVLASIVCIALLALPLRQLF